MSHSKSLKRSREAPADNPTRKKASLTLSPSPAPAPAPALAPFPTHTQPPQPDYLSALPDLPRQLIIDQLDLKSLSRLAQTCRQSYADVTTTVLLSATLKESSALSRELKAQTSLCGLRHQLDVRELGQLVEELPALLGTQRGLRCWRRHWYQAKLQALDSLHAGTSKLLELMALGKSCQRRVLLVMDKYEAQDGLLSVRDRALLGQIAGVFRQCFEHVSERAIKENFARERDNLMHVLELVEAYVPPS